MSPTPDWAETARVWERTRGTATPGGVGIDSISTGPSPSVPLVNHWLTSRSTRASITSCRCISNPLTALTRSRRRHGPASRRQSPNDDRGVTCERTGGTVLPGRMICAWCLVLPMAGCHASCRRPFTCSPGGMRAARPRTITGGQASRGWSAPLAQAADVGAYAGALGNRRAELHVGSQRPLASARRRTYSARRRPVVLPIIVRRYARPDGAYARSPAHSVKCRLERRPGRCRERVHVSCPSSRMLARISACSMPVR